MGAKTKRRKAPVEQMDGPTPEQLANGNYGRELQPDHKVAPIKRIPAIVTLASTGKITQRQYLALNRYREIAINCDYSPIEDSVGKLSKVRGGNGGMGHAPFATRAEIELQWLEQELGALRDIARAIAVDDMTPSQWAMKQSGSIERTRGIIPKIVTWFEPRRKALGVAMVEIRIAGDRLASAIRA